MKRQIIGGIGWTTAGRMIRELTNFVVGIVLARLLTPEEFGLFGMVFVFIQFARVFSKLGFTGAVVQAQEVSEIQLSTIFWINLAMGIVISVLFMLGAPLVARFYDEPRLVSITIVISLVLAIGSLNDLQVALLQRFMQFRRQMLINVFSALISGTVAIGMALTGFGVWSLVGEFFVGASINVLVMWFTTPWKPKFIFDLSSITDMLKFSVGLQGFQLSNYLVKNIDNLLVGRYLDVFTLGIYRIAYKYMMLINGLLSPVLRPVLVAALSRIQDEHERLRIIYVKISQVLSFFTMPLAVGLIVTADTFILTLLGDKWVDAIPVLRLLAVATIALPLLDTRNWLTVALGRSDILLRWQIVDGVLSTILFFIGVQFGVYGVAGAFVFRTYLLFYPLIAIPGRIVNLSFGTYMLKLLPTILISACMGGLVWLATVMALGGLAPFVALTLQVMLGGVVYLGLSILFRVEALSDIIRLARETVFDRSTIPRVDVLDSAN